MSRTHRRLIRQVRRMHMDNLSMAHVIAMQGWLDSLATTGVELKPAADASPWGEAGLVTDDGRCHDVMHDRAPLEHPKEGV